MFYISIFLSQPLMRLKRMHTLKYFFYFSLALSKYSLESKINVYLKYFIPIEQVSIEKRISLLMRVNWKKRVWDRDERKDNDAFRDDDVAKSEKILSLKSTPQRERIIQHEFHFNSFTRLTSFYLMPCFCKRFPNTHSNNFILTKKFRHIILGKW